MTIFPVDICGDIAVHNANAKTAIAVQIFMLIFCFCIQLTHENPKAQRYLLGAFEQLVGTVHRGVLLPKVPHILKTFYELDIIDETVLIEWDEKVIIFFLLNNVVMAQLYRLVSCWCMYCC